MKRTKKQKIKAQTSRVNTQLTYNFDKSYNQNEEIKESVNTDINSSLGSIKKSYIEA